jgi:predicted peptidase
MRRRIYDTGMTRSWTLLAILATAMAARAAGAETETAFLDRTVESGGATHRYKVYLPPGFDARKSWPVILFLHGGGERGTDAVRHTEVGLGAAVRAHPELYPAVIVFPQIPRGQVWFGEQADFATAALDQVMAEFGGDPDRVSLVGLSLGGYGVWSLAYARPDRYAAIVSIAGGIVPPAYMRARLQVLPETLAADDPYAATASKVKRIPAWLFHGAADDSVPVTESRLLVEALKKAGGAPKYTEYAGAPHNVWDRAFAEPGLAEWLMAQRRPRAGKAGQGSSAK